MSYLLTPLLENVVGEEATGETGATDVVSAVLGTNCILNEETED